MKNGKRSVIDIIVTDILAKDTSNVVGEAWQEGANFNAQKCLDEGTGKGQLSIRGRSR